MSDESSKMFVPIGKVAEDVSSASKPTTGDADTHTHTPAQTEKEGAAAVAVTTSASDAAGEEHDHGHFQPEMEGDVMVLESLCVACEGTGTTRLLLTHIPFFKDVILMAFECEECGYKNSEVQSAEVQEKGCHFEVTCTSEKDMNRQLVKSDRASVRIPELDFEIPSITQKGVFTTIEGLLDRAVENLSGTQTVRRRVDPEGAEQVEAFITRLRELREGRAFPFTLILDDPSGNSFLENPNAPVHDPQMKVRYYTRTVEQNHELGCYAESGREGVLAEGEASAAAAHPGGAAAGDADAAHADDDSTLFGSKAQTTITRDGNIPSKFKKGGALIRNPTERNALTDRRRQAGAVRGQGGKVDALIFDSSSSDAAKEVMRFPQDCFNCSARGECLMCVTDVPHFKEVILMAFTCDECGWRNVEVKGGGAVPPHGTITELYYDPAAPGAEQDMTRDLIKGDTASIEVPEISLVVVQGSLGGMYTTVEGLLTAVRDKLLESNPFMHGTADSASAEQRAKFQDFLDKLDEVVAGRVPFTLRLRDPMANTWLYSPLAPAPDPRVNHMDYTRSMDEDLALGLLDMKTEGYAEDDDADAPAALPQDAPPGAAAPQAGDATSAPPGADGAAVAQ